MRPANDLSKYDPPIALLFARDNLPLTSPRRIFMRSSVQISSPHSAYSAHKAFATCLWSRISMLGARHMSLSWHDNQGKVHLCCNKCQGPEQTRPNHLWKDQAPWPNALQESTWQHENPTKSATNSASSANLFEVPADAHEGQGSTWKYKLMLQFYCMITTLFSLIVGNLMSFSASPAWSFWLLETPLVVSMWLPVLTSRGEGETPDIKSMLQASIPKAGFPTFFPMFDPYIHVTWKCIPHTIIIGIRFMELVCYKMIFSETTSLVVNPLIPLLHIFGFTGFS